MRSKLLRTVLYAIILALGWNCEKKEITNTQIEPAQENSIEVLEGTFADFMKSKSDFHEAYGLYDVLMNEKAHLSKTGKQTSGQYDFIVDTTTIKSITINGKTSYTFYVKAKQPQNYFENVIIDRDSTGNLNAFLIKYTPNKIMDNMKDHSSQTFEGERRITKLNINNINFASKSSNKGCTITITTTWCSYSTDHIAGSGCANDGRLYNVTTTYIDTSCGGGGTGSGEEGNNQEYNDSYYEENNNYKRIGVKTSPITGTTKVNWLRSKLNIQDPELIWHLEKDEGFTDELTNYIEENNNSQGIAFAKAAANTFVNGDVDFENEIIYDNSFLNTKAACVLEKLLTQTGYFKNVMDAFTNNNSQYRIKFTTGPVRDGADAQTSEPDADGIITIIFRPSSANGKVLEIAGQLLHEGAHAQLHRMLASGNKASYNLSVNEYKWLLDLNEWWKDNSTMPEQTAQHDYMTMRYVSPIANAVRKYDSFKHSINNYMYFGWEGLYDLGRNRGMISKSQFDEYTRLAQIPLNDNHKTSCEL